ncbi:MAG: C2H2-type zinc finger protein [Dehalococcoidia bacterium]|nr:C2H2-type zinc finger protein [Dehalococcoidia bacterium]
MVKCDICGATFKNTQGLGGHMKLAHNADGPSGQHSVLPPTLEEDPELSAIKREVKVAQYNAELVKLRALMEHWDERLRKTEKENGILHELILDSVDTALAQALSFSKGHAEWWRVPDEQIRSWVNNFAENIEINIRNKSTR